MRFPGYFFRALSSKKVAGEIEIANNSASVFTQDESVCCNVAILSIQGKKDIYLDNGVLFTLSEFLTPQQEKTLLSKVSRSISWLESFSFTKAIVLSLILISVLAVFRLVFTSITAVVVSSFPDEWEEIIGKNTYDTLKKTTFSETELSSERIARLRTKAMQLAAKNGFAGSEVFFHRANSIGANAIAFPGGPVVVTDELVHLLESDDLILGVIAHEFAHVQQRHSLHQIMEVIGFAVVASILFSSDDTLIEEASFIGLSLWASKKSREFEKEADLISVKYLENAGVDKVSFGLALKKLVSNSCRPTSEISLQECLEKDGSGWLSSHPSGAERLEILSLQ